jgi:hypothetical protein
MFKQIRVSIPFVAVLLLTPLAGCGGDDGDEGEVKRKAKPVAGTFVGKVPETEAFVSVVASPLAKGQHKRDVSVFICDAKRLCDSFSGSASGNDFVAAAEEGDGKAEGKLTRKAVTGRIALTGGQTVRYLASTATATAGLYDLTVSSSGKLRGASAAGVGLTGTSALANRGSGTLKLADGKRLDFDVTGNSADDPVRLPAGRVRLIVLPDYQLKGAGRSRGRGSDFFIRSS